MPLSEEDKKRMQLQSDEFDAVDRLSKEWRRLQMTPVVDDDYSEVRHDYTCAVRNFVDKLIDQDKIKLIVDLRALSEKLQKEIQEFKCPTPELEGTHPIVLYFGNDEDRNEFTDIIKEAMPGLTAKKL